MLDMENEIAIMAGEMIQFLERNRLMNQFEEQQIERGFDPEHTDFVIQHIKEEI